MKVSYSSSGIQATAGRHKQITHSRTARRSGSGREVSNPCDSPLSPSEWLLEPDHQSERYGRADSNNDARTSSRSSDSNLHFMNDVREIPISPMMGHSDNTWDFDFDEGRGTTVDSSASRRRQSFFPDLSPRSSGKQLVPPPLFSPVSMQRDRGQSFSSNRSSSSNSSARRETQRIQSASGGELTPGGLRSGAHGTEPELEVAPDSWACKMIRHHSEPSLRPKCRQSTRNPHDRGCLHAGPAHLAGASDFAAAGDAPLVLDHRASLRTNARKPQADALVLARIRDRRVSNN